ncbi:prostasin-like [Ochlerotatus camptorhynchus]|uniref:prostasin-like n=1 Tax=Ochlerotatus camptorhynchus TaxID=644619 RepID=UPI0031DAC989
MNISRGIPHVLGVVLVVWLQIAKTEVYEDWGQASAAVQFIVGGDIVNKRGLYPWHVAILHKANYQGGGSLISQQFVLTVTHVTYDHLGEMIDPKSLTIKAGMIKLTDDANADSYKVAETLRYPGYNQENLMHDICMLKVDGKVSFGKYVRPIFLWDNSDKVLSKLADEKHKATVIGFGLTGAGSSRNNDLRSASVAPIGSEDCIKGFKGFKEVLWKGRNFCVKDAEATVCRGDSGSGLVNYVQQRKAYFLRGLVSQGHASCSKGSEAVFTDVGHYLKWIEKTALPTMFNLLGNPTCDGVSKNKQSQVSLPGLVNLKYSFRKSFFISDCHGILITKKHVLTQANCVASNSVRKLHSVATGSSVINDYSKLSQQYAIETVSVEKELGIITLSDEVAESDKPVCIPTRPEEGKLSVLFWKRKLNHPKYVQQLSTIDQSKQMANIREILSVNVTGDTGNLRLGSAPLLYTVDDETGVHLYLRALEKCSIQGCPDGQSPAFVDVLKYRQWIKEIAGQYMNHDLLTPKLGD